MRQAAFLCCILSLVPSRVFARTSPPETGVSERIATWKGEKIILREHYCDATPKVTPQLRGQTGVVIQSAWEKGRARITIELDVSHSTIVMTDASCLGFFSEKELLDKLVGRTFWTKGHFHYQAGKPLAPLTKVVASRVEWWWGILDSMSLCLKTEDGRELGLSFRVPIRPCVLSRFCEGEDAESWDPANELFEQDPRMLYPTWTQDTFALIQRGIVAVGMSDEMVKATCGRFLEQTGAVLSPQGKASPTYRCNGYEFLIENGKVTKSEKRE